jgi:hypothetical protein
MRLREKKKKLYRVKSAYLENTMNRNKIMKISRKAIKKEVASYNLKPSYSYIFNSPINIFLILMYWQFIKLQY